MSEWKEYKLGDLTIDGKGHYGIAAPAVEYDSSKYTYLRITDINDDGTLNKCGLKSVSDAKAKDFLLRPNDIVFARTGASVGRSYFFDGKDGELVYAGFLIMFRLDPEKVCPYIIKAYTHSQEYYDWIRAVDNGATRGNINAQTFASMPIVLPPLDEQKRIAGVLSSLDDKIDLLHRENATLEALAETLFRHYFIENPNPDWKEGKLTDFIKIIGGGTPKTNEPSYWNGDIGWLSGGDISGNHKNYILNVEKYITQKGVDNSSVNILPENSMIISARGTVGKYCLLGRPMAFSQSNYGILPKINGCYFFTYLLVSRFVEEMKNAAYGSVFDTITTKTFESIDVFLPSEKEVIVVFDNQVKPIFEKLKRNQLQIQSMLSQRDTLLPRLMNGEVKVGE